LRIFLTAEGAENTESEGIFEPQIAQIHTDFWGHNGAVSRRAATKGLDFI